jgi:hypothetical protein
VLFSIGTAVFVSGCVSQARPLFESGSTRRNCSVFHCGSGCVGWLTWFKPVVPHQPGAVPFRSSDWGSIMTVPTPLVAFRQQQVAVFQQQRIAEAKAAQPRVRTFNTPSVPASVPARSVTDAERNAKRFAVLLEQQEKLSAQIAEQQRKGRDTGKLWGKLRSVNDHLVAGHDRGRWTY